jgi:hypothetical protein
VLRFTPRNHIITAQFDVAMASQAAELGSSNATIAWRSRKRDNRGPGLAALMMKPATLFRFLNEFTVLLLGGLLIVLALSGRVGLPERPIALVLLGIVLIYWGARALLRGEPEGGRQQAQIRAASLVVVGALVLAIPMLPMRDADPLLEIAGAVLVLRGLLGSVLAMRSVRRV